MLDSAVLALTDQGRTGEEHGDQGDAIDELHHAHEGRDVEIRIELHPDDEVHRWSGYFCWSRHEAREFLRDDALDIARTSAGLGHGGGVHVELNRGSPSPH